MFMFFFFSLVDPEFSLSHFTTSIMPKEVIFQAGHTRRGKPTIDQKVVKPSKVIPTKRGPEAPVPSGSRDLSHSPGKKRRLANNTPSSHTIGGPHASGGKKKSGKVSF
jgi:hypothetical protein